MLTSHHCLRGFNRSRIVTYCLLRHFYTFKKQVPSEISPQILYRRSRFSQEGHNWACSFKSDSHSSRLQTCSIHNGVQTFCENVDIKKSQTAEHAHNAEKDVHSTPESDGVRAEKNSFLGKSSEVKEKVTTQGCDEEQCDNTGAMILTEDDSAVSILPISDMEVGRPSYSKEPVSIIDRLLKDREQSNNDINTQTTDISTEVQETSVSAQTVTQKVYIPPISNVSPIVNESNVLKSLVELGVDVSVYVEKGMAEKVILMDFEKDIKPYVMLLHNAGVTDDNLGTVLTKNPYIFQHDVEHLQVRINYLLSKKFTKKQIGQMLVRESVFICMETKRIDAKLGFYQKEFRLKGHELREVTSRYAKLITENVTLFKRNKVYINEFLGFNDSEVRTFFLASPKSFFGDMRSISAKFDYVHNVMGVPHHLIAKSGWILNKNTMVLKNRHRFLLKLGRAQFDPNKENYVSFAALIHPNKELFCVEVAKASVKEFDDFQRLL